MKNQRVGIRASTVTGVLERAWTRLRAQIPRLPAAVIIPLDAKSRRRASGHFAASTWRVRGPEQAHEIAISPELFDDPAGLLETLLHEAAHAWLYATDHANSVHIGGVSPDRRGYLYYHRKEFRDAARALGLACGYLNGRYGWTLTRWPSTGVPNRYRSVLRLLERTLPWGSATVPARWRRAGRPTPKSGQVRLHCACSDPRTIYVARAETARDAIVCQMCLVAFAPSGVRGEALPENAEEPEEASPGVEGDPD